MAQNVYDSPTFFHEYSQLLRSKEGLDGAAEWPTMRKLVGDVTLADILDIGCGYGWFCRWASAAGATSVHGIDVSRKMLEQAQTYPHDPKITYEQGDLETINLPSARYDVVYSSLALHYLPSLEPLFRQISQCLRKGGVFVFSVEHPIMTAPSDASWVKGDDGNVHWRLNDYAKEGLRVTNWLGTGDVHKYHHCVETYLKVLLDSGLSLEGFRESWEGMDVSCTPDIPESGHRPYFVLAKARKL